GTWGARERRSTTRWSRSCATSGARFDGSGSALASSLAPRAVHTALAITGSIAVALAAIALVPSVAHAWTPGTHVFLGEAVMRSLSLLPRAIAELLRAFPYDFLYGSIAADTSIAKKYAPVGRHCHSWMVGMEILNGARDEPLRAFS